nr:bile acid:sodium symporter [Spirochaetota bacterium]
MNKYFIIFLLSSIFLGIILPFGNLLKPALPFFLGTLLFFSFIDIDFNFKSFFRIEILYSSLVTFVIAPAILFFATQNLDINYRIGLFLIAITPTAIGASIIVKITKGQFDFSIILTIFNNFISILAYPLLLKIYFNDDSTKVDFFSIFISLFMVITIPFFLSLITKKSYILRSKMKKASKYINFLFILVVYIAISSASHNFRDRNLSELLTIFPITFCIALTYFAAGFFLGKDIEIKKTLSSCMGQKNTGLCIMVALSNFSPLTAIPAAMYIIIHHLINAFIIYKFSSPFFYEK